VMRLRPLRTSASLLRVVRGTLDLLEISLRTDVTDAGTWGMLPRMRTWFLLMVRRTMRRRSSSWRSDIEIGALMTPPEWQQTCRAFYLKVWGA